MILGWGTILKKKWMFLISVVIFFSLSACSNTVQQGTLSPPADGVQAVVSYVVDGDTIDVVFNDGTKERVRLTLIDTPETKHPTKPVQPFGPEASDFAKKALLNKEVILEFDVQERDQYGRMLAYVYVDNSMINEILIQKGLARVAVYPPNTKYVDEFRATEKDARKNERGIWSLENYATDRGFHSKTDSVDDSTKNKDKGTTSFSPDKNGNCKGEIKGNQGSNGWVYHLPGGQHYSETKAEACFYTKEEAENAGYRRATR